MEGVLRLLFGLKRGEVLEQLFNESVLESIRLDKLPFAALGMNGTFQKKGARIPKGFLAPCPHRELFIENNKSLFTKMD